MPEIHRWEAMMRPNHTFKHLIDEGFRPFRKDVVVWAKQMSEPFVVPTPEGPVRGEAGDYWCVGPGNQQWLSHAPAFERSHKPVWHPAGSETHLVNAETPPALQVEALRTECDRDETQVRPEGGCLHALRGF
jgi:hypothetical protein